MPTTIEDLLATAAEHHRLLDEQAEAEARERLAQEQAEAEKANSAFWVNLAVATEAVKTTHGYPGITGLLTGLSGVLRSGRLPSGAPAPASTADLQPEVDRLEAELATANAEIARLEGELAGAADPAELARLTTRLSNLQMQFDSKESELATANAEIARLEGELAGAADPAELARLTRELATANSLVADAKSQVDDLPTLRGSATIGGRHLKVPIADVESTNDGVDNLRILLGLPPLDEDDD